MKQLPTLSIKCKSSEEPLTLEFDLDSVVLYDRSTKRITPLTPVEEVLLSLIMEQQDRCDTLEEALKYPPDKADAVVQVDYEGGPTLFGYKMKPTWPSEAGEAAADLAEGVMCYVSNCLAGSSWNDLSQTRRESILRGLAHLIHRATTK